MTSVNDKLERVRKPRVHIKYEVETEDGMLEKELPFVVGVLGDFSGNDPQTDKKDLRDRKFVSIDRDNFNDVMQRVSPGVNLRVENTLADDDSEINVQLQFNRLEDFEPTQIVEQVPALKQLMNTRNKLRDLLTKSDRSHELEALLEQALQDPEKLQQLASELNQLDDKA